MHYFMEQYWLPKKLDFENLRKCLDNYETESIFIRLKGSLGGDIKLDEDLTDKVLDFKKDDSGLYLSIDSKEVFHFPLKDYKAGFDLAYERIKKDKNSVIPGKRLNPYEPGLPEPKKSILRHTFDNHSFELYFKGRIDLKFHSWWNLTDLKYWTIK
jgi:hypothetical protein